MKFLIFIANAVLVWGVTICFVWLIGLCFSCPFDLRSATGVYLVLALLALFLKPQINNKK